MFSISKNYAFVFKINHTTDAKYFTKQILVPSVDLFLF